MKTTVHILENSEVEVEVVLPAEKVEKYRQAVESEVLQNIEVDGFRKGHAPKEKALKEISSLKVWEEMAQRAISAAYVDILEKEDIKAIGQPHIMITKIAEKSPLEFKITTAVMPEIKLAEYAKIAKELNKEDVGEEVEEAEVESAIKNLQKMRLQQDLARDAKEGEKPSSWKDIEEKDLPELTDEWVKEMGKFEDVSDFKVKMKENLVEEKRAKNIEKRRIALIDGILESSTISVPDIMVQYEIDKMMHEFEGNIAMTGTSFDDYLESIKKTREDYRVQWQEQAKKRAQTQVMLNEIAAREKIEPSDEDIEKEVKQIMDQYKNQKGIDENNVRAYVASVLTHQKVFEYLEELK